MPAGFGFSLQLLNNMKIRASYSAFFALFLLMGCSDKELQKRVDRLEAELREVRSDTRDQVNVLQDRVEAAEAKVGPSTSTTNIEERLSKLTGSVNQIMRSQSASDKMAYLRPHLNGHSPLPTDHGTFLVRIEGMDLDAKAGGYQIHLNIGNPLALAVQQFTLRGDYGGGVPELKEGEEYSIYNKKIEEWQKTLTPFQATITKTLTPYSWTPFSIAVKADSRDDLQLIRFTMKVENAHLEKAGSSKSSGGTVGHLRVDSKSASALKTDYGAFLIAIKKAEKGPNGTVLHIEIGNPYGFTINQCRLVGDFGEDVPKRSPSEDQAKFAERIQVWTDSLQPFDAMISSKLSAFRWNKAVITVPGPPEQVKFLRCQLRVENVTLPNAAR